MFHRHAPLTLSLALALAATVSAQYQIQDGNRLDRSLQVGTGGLNQPAPTRPNERPRTRVTGVGQIAADDPAAFSALAGTPTYNPLAYGRQTSSINAVPVYTLNRPLAVNARGQRINTITLGGSAAEMPYASPQFSGLQLFMPASVQPRGYALPQYIPTLESTLARAARTAAEARDELPADGALATALRTPPDLTGRSSLPGAGNLTSIEAVRRATGATTEAEVRSLRTALETSRIVQPLDTEQSVNFLRRFNPAAEARANDSERPRPMPLLELISNMDDRGSIERENPVKQPDPAELEALANRPTAEQMAALRKQSEESLNAARIAMLQRDFFKAIGEYRIAALNVQLLERDDLNRIEAHLATGSYILATVLAEEFFTKYGKVPSSFPHIHANDRAWHRYQLSQRLQTGEREDNRFWFSILQLPATIDQEALVRVLTETMRANPATGTAGRLPPGLRKLLLAEE